MKKILIIDNGSKDFKREIIKPFFSLPVETFSINIESSENFRQCDSVGYDYIIFSKCLYGDWQKTIDFIKSNKELRNTNNKNIYPEIIYYINEYWHLPTYHRWRKVYNKHKIGNYIENIIRLSDYVVTYSKDLLDEIKRIRLNEKVIHFENFFIPENIKCETHLHKPTIGFVPNGVYDYENYMELDGIQKNIKETQFKFFDTQQYVLVGFDIRSTTQEVNDYTKEIVEIKTKPQDTIWATYEKIITNNYKICSQQYKDFLLKFLPNSKYEGDINEEPYKRIWYNEVKDNVLNYNILVTPKRKNKYNLLTLNYEQEVAKRVITPRGKFIETLDTWYLPKSKKAIMKAITNISFSYRQVTMFEDKPYENNFINNLNFLTK